MGKQKATLTGIQLVDIHGSRFYDLTFVTEASPDKPKTSRIGTESVYAGPQVGDIVFVSLLLGQLTGVVKA